MSERDIADARRAPANENGPERMTLEFLEKDPWNAVDLPLPADADRTLLERAAFAAAECAKAAFAASRIAEITQPGLAASYRLRSTEADDRCDEARRKVGELSPGQVSRVSPFLQPAEVQDKALISLMTGVAEERGSEPRATITAAAIDKNPWSIVWSNLSGVDPELLNRVQNTAIGLVREAMERRDEGSYTREEAALWNRYAEAAISTYADAYRELNILGERAARRQREHGGAAELEHGAGARGAEDFGNAAFDTTEANGAVRAAWRAPAFSRATIEADPWTAVYLPIPEKADIWLLMKAFDAARFCQDMTPRGSGFGPQLEPGKDGPAENMQRAEARAGEIADEIERRMETVRKPGQMRETAAGSTTLEPAAAPRTARPDADLEVPAEPLTRQAIARDRWSAVALDIPEDASRELLSLIATTARDLRHSLAARANTAAREEEALEFLGLGMEAKQRQKEAEARLGGSDGGRERSRDHDAGLMLQDWRNRFDGEGLPDVSPGWIDYDPWRAITAPLPRDASADFLNLVADTAGELKAEAERRSGIAPNGDDARDWRQIAEEAGQRLDHTQQRLETLRTVERTPERDRRALIETLGEPAFRAVNEPLPRTADAETLEHLSDYVDFALDRLDALSRSSHATTISPAYVTEQFEKASARLDEVKDRLDPAETVELGRAQEPLAATRNEFTRDDVQGNPWAIVDKDIPREADASMLVEARAAVAACVEALAWEIEWENARDNPAYSPGYIDARLDMAIARLAELDERIEGADARELVPGDLVSSRLAEYTLGAMDFTLDVLTGDFIDEAVLRPDQVHDAASIDAARANETAGPQKAAARDAIKPEIAGKSPEVEAGAGGQPARRDRIYERYPSLTYGDNGDYRRTPADERDLDDRDPERTR